MAQSGSGYHAKMDVGISGQKGAQKGTPGCGWGCWGCLGFIVVGVVAIGITALSGGGSGSNDAELRGITAERACEDAVRDALKAPSTAEFADSSSSRSGSTWTVTGAVDAENSFGAMLRNTFECSVTFQGDSAYATVTRLG